MLEHIGSPADIKQLDISRKYALAEEIREKIIQTVSQNGGHLASNLGCVEMIIAMHAVFDAPRDKIVFDVGHQAYAHKLRTGRYACFDTLRQAGGISGFTRVGESEYDTVCSGHASDSLSIALGMARARDLKGEKHEVVAFLGDGALTGGMCYEALNDAGQSKARLIILLNDNEMSISRNVGAMSRHLTHMRQSSVYRSMKQFVRGKLQRLPKGGKGPVRVLSGLKDALKALLVNDLFFDSLDIEYLGPIDGHDIAEMERVFKNARNYDRPVVIHCVTRKGKGYAPAENDPAPFHGVEAFDVKSGKSVEPSFPSCGKEASAWLADKARQDKRICAVSAAMLSGTGLLGFAAEYPDRCFDVGIAEEHACALAAGMALSGMKPYLALYSTFLQRACDQINVNICLNKAPVTLLIDRAGLTGRDGETHQGVFDLSFLRALPNLIIGSPANLYELKRMLELSLCADAPFAIRYPKQLPDSDAVCAFGMGEWSEVKAGGDVCLIAYGQMLLETQAAAAFLEQRGINAAVFNARFLKPLDEDTLKRIAHTYSHVFVFEDCVCAGSLGEAVCAYLQRMRSAANVYIKTVPDMYLPAGSVREQLNMCGLDADALAAYVLEKTETFK